MLWVRNERVNVTLLSAVPIVSFHLIGEARMAATSDSNPQAAAEEVLS